MAELRRYDLGVVGGGSAGFAAALAAARTGLNVVLAEALPRCGGTAVYAGVNCWEMGVGGTGIPFDLYRSLRRDAPGATAVVSTGRHFMFQKPRYWPDEPGKTCFPGGERILNPDRTYVDTLRRHPGRDHVKDEAFIREFWHGVSFLPEPMADAMEAMLAETARVKLLTNLRLVSVDASDGRIRSATLSDGTRLVADRFIDGCGALARAAGCTMLRGVDPRSRFDEPSAPEQGSDEVNAVTLVYRVTPCERDQIEPLPDGVPDTCWWAKHFPAASCVWGPDGGLNVNMLPTMEGREWLRLGDAAMPECRRRVRAHWHFLQTHWPEFRRLCFTWNNPMLGIRECDRVLCDRMLAEHDLLAGLSGQVDPDLIALSDHAFDRHGEGGGIRELDEPYGVPYRCLIPAGWRNLLIAGRSAGFSSIAASSCRLIRTMMQLGQAAGTAATLSKDLVCDFPDVDPARLRDALRRQHVQLEFPLSPELREHLAAG
jgi:hypothetical protein